MLKRVAMVTAALAVLAVLSVPDAGAYCMDCRYNPRTGRQGCYFSNWGAAICGMDHGECSTFGECREPI